MELSQSANIFKVYSFSRPDAKLFVASTSLTVLSISHNWLFHMEADAFAAMTQLQYIDLSHNRLVVLEASTFRGLEAHLNHVDLGDNQLMLVSQRAFASFTQLENVNLRGNPIGRFHPKRLDGLCASSPACDLTF